MLMPRLAAFPFHKFALFMVHCACRCMSTTRSISQSISDCLMSSSEPDIKPQKPQNSGPRTTVDTWRLGTGSNTNNFLFFTISEQEPTRTWRRREFRLRKRLRLKTVDHPLIFLSLVHVETSMIGSRDQRNIPHVSYASTVVCRFRTPSA